MAYPNHLFAGLRKAFNARTWFLAGADTPIHVHRRACLAQMDGSS